MKSRDVFETVSRALSLGNELSKTPLTYSRWLNWNDNISFLFDVEDWYTGASMEISFESPLAETQTNDSISI